MMEFYSFCFDARSLLPYSMPERKKEAGSRKKHAIPLAYLNISRISEGDPVGIIVVGRCR